MRPRAPGARRRRLPDDAQLGETAMHLTQEPLHPPAPVLQPRHRRHWRANLRITGALLAIWAGVAFGVAWWARGLDFVFFGWPFSFWVAAQGAPIFFLLIVVFYAGCMNRLDHAQGVSEDDQDSPGEQGA
jgi:putative solute:sodium symporter small subunit